MNFSHRFRHYDLLAVGIGEAQCRRRDLLAAQYGLVASILDRSLEVTA
jgi:hypothetical protein